MAKETFEQKIKRLANAETPADQYNFGDAEAYLNQANYDYNRLYDVMGPENRRIQEQSIKAVTDVYNQKKSEMQTQLQEQQKQMEADEARLKAQEEARIAKQKKDTEIISLLGQKDLAGVAKEYGTTDLGAATELKRQREENARKQVQSEKIESMSLRIARGQRGRRGVATGSTGGRGFFERYFQQKLDTGDK